MGSEWADDPLPLRWAPLWLLVMLGTDITHHVHVARLKQINMPQRVMCTVIETEAVT